MVNSDLAKRNISVFSSATRGTKVEHCGSRDRSVTRLFIETRVIGRWPRSVAGIAAAGRHNLLTVGTAGAGKSRVTVRLPGISPPLEPTEALELGMIQSVAGGPTP
jgi:hypothetical protein